MGKADKARDELVKQLSEPIDLSPSGAARSCNPCRQSYAPRPRGRPN